MKSYQSENIVCLCFQQMDKSEYIDSIFYNCKFKEFLKVITVEAAL